MKELDLLFDGFVESHASELDTGAWPELEALLQTEDDQLWDWIQHPEKCTDQRFAQLLLEVQRAT